MQGNMKLYKNVDGIILW